MRKTIAGLVALLAFAATVFVPSVARAEPPDCDSPNPPPRCTEDPDPINHDPEGTIQVARRVPAGVFISGIASDADGDNVRVVVKINGVEAGTVIADQPEPGLGNVRFSGVVPAVNRGAPVCATARNIGTGHDRTIGCVNTTVALDPFGYVDTFFNHAGEVYVEGWAIDPDTTAALQVDILHDDQVAQTVTANASRTDVGAVYPDYGSNHGFAVRFPEKQNDGTHTVCARARYVPGAGGAEANGDLGCRTYTVRHLPTGSPVQVTRTGSTVRVRGTASDPDEPGAPVDVHIYHDNAFHGSVPTVGTAYDTTFPATMTSGDHTVCTHAINRGPGTNNVPLGCGTYTLPQPVSRPSVAITGRSLYGFDVTWTASASAAGYRIEVSPEGGQYTVYREVGASDLKAWPRNLMPSTVYCVRVVAFNDLSSATSDQACTRTLHPSLPVATGLSFRDITATAATLVWNDNADLEANYRLDIVRGPGDVTSTMIPGVAGTGQRTHRISGLTPNTRYEIYLYTVHPDHDWSAAPAAFTTAGPPVVSSFGTNPSAVAACADTGDTSPDMSVSFSVSFANRVVIQRGNVTVFDRTVTGNGPWSQSVAIGRATGGTAFTLVAYSPSGDATTRSLTVPWASLLPMARQMHLSNWGVQPRTFFYVTEDGYYEEIATLLPAESMYYYPADCVRFRIEAWDVWSNTMALKTSWLIGHPAGLPFDAYGKPVY